MNSIAFNIPYTCQESINNVRYLIDNPTKINEGYFQKKCKQWFEELYPEHDAFITTSCTRALELIALSLKLSENDEIILSPYTYVGVGNAFANYGAKLVFVDIDSNTMNINADLIESAITNKTKAIIAMHYAGIPCELYKIKVICNKHNLLLIEDNAQGIGVSYNKHLLGSYGDFSCMSFDMLKNISSNEGGVLLCKKEWTDVVDISYNNGTNKTAFSKGEVSKYEWINKGSKFAMSEYTAAVLFPLLEKADIINKERKKIWNLLYDKLYSDYKLKQFIPEILMQVEHNAHLAYLKFNNQQQRNTVLEYLNKKGISCSFHYVPLDNSTTGKLNSKMDTICENSLHESNCLLRLPMHNYLKEEDINLIVSCLKEAIA
jgi:dTDP-4-amino-4,6-dideoxygalactose transaminase